jgi:hypothetical protein
MLVRRASRGPVQNEQVIGGDSKDLLAAIAHMRLVSEHE